LEKTFCSCSFVVVEEDRSRIRPYL